ncbi:hypothetical protein J4217_00620 [Candidatus Pacearchaeota archaeon]|nr:hypothetical protein [Candidatus Pacearchaeota archaeon]
MADKDIIISEKLDYRGLVKFSDLYQYAHSWFMEENYGVIEEKYSEKVSGNNKEIDIEWKCTKPMGDYFKIEQKLVWEIKGLVDVEVEIDGKKTKMNQGQVKITFKGAIIKDYSSKWDRSPFNRFLRDTYNKFIIPQRIDAMEDKIKADIRSLKDDLKAYLDLSGKR